LLVQVAGGGGGMKIHKWRKTEWAFWNNDNAMTYKIRFVQWVKARKLRIRELAKEATK